MTDDEKVQTLLAIKLAMGGMHLAPDGVTIRDNKNSEPMFRYIGWVRCGHDGFDVKLDIIQRQTTIHLGNAIDGHELGENLPEFNGPDTVH